eukprot:TRINITY_DN6845_c0_g1_i1.p2 TRINITY_DN6845_c0_g1~~TRINITY_DN6845_c0_g1_i1.p2  ORF type:complete len:212 (-),score=65.55 TRINITY_DN6845_c0_g1_i1:89-724(-)
MVFYFTCSDPSYTIYMGRDKYENEELIKYGFPEDVWFHVDKLSSAHVYMRLKKGQTMDDIPPTMIDECCQLVKANSIEGCKEPAVAVVYTPWANLKKTGNMDVGQVGFHNEKQVRKVNTVERKRETVNRLEKTRVEKDNVDFAALRAARDKQERDEKKKLQKEKEAQDKKAAEEKRKADELRSYTTFMDPSAMKSNLEMKKTVADYEDDFM